MADGAVLVSREQTGTTSNTRNADNAGIDQLAGSYAEPIIMGMQDMLQAISELAFTDPVAIPELTDRCDRCGAAAVTGFTIGAGELSFCGHHTRRHLNALSDIGATPRAVHVKKLWFLDLQDPTDT